MPEAAPVAHPAGVTSDAWLSGIFGHRVLRIDSGTVPASRELDATGAGGSADSVFAWTKVDISDIASVAALTETGFRVVDVALTFEGHVTRDESPRVRPATPADREQVEIIAGSCFRFSRFHADPHVADALANRIKANWVGNFFAGQRGDAMLVAEHDGAVAGFIQLLHGANGETIIDLVGVAIESQGHGLGSELVCSAARHGAARLGGTSRVVVGTQAANTRSVRLYESHGLRLASAQYVLHYHRSGSGYGRPR